MSGHRGRYLVAVFTVVPPHTWQNVCGGSVASSLSAASTNDSVRNTRSASTADAWSHLLIVFTADVNPAHNTVTRVIRKHAHKRTRGMLLSNGRNPAAVGRLCWRRWVSYHRTHRTHHTLCMPPTHREEQTTGTRPWYPSGETLSCPIGGHTGGAYPPHPSFRKACPCVGGVSPVWC